MKKSILIILLLLIIGYLVYPAKSSKTEFYLTNKEYEFYIKRAINKKDFYAIDKLYMYYTYSLCDYNKSIEILRLGAKFGDPVSQYRLSLYFLRDYYPYNRKESFKGEGLYWLKKSAN